jgi:Carboxypeptidase regulatory-like domain
MIRRTCSIVAGIVLALFLLAPSALAQITTGTVTGRVVDATGGVVAGARVILISESRGTRSAAVVTNDSGDYVFPNVPAAIHIRQDRIHRVGSSGQSYGRVVPAAGFGSQENRARRRV